jgi:hypothetical protein
MTNHEAAQLAISVLTMHHTDPGYRDARIEAMRALRQALADEAACKPLGTDAPVRGFVILHTAQERDHVKKHDLHVEYADGYWLARQGRKCMTSCYPTPEEAIRETMPGGKHEIEAVRALDPRDQPKPS